MTYNMTEGGKENKQKIQENKTSHPLGIFV